ncbi:antitoxin VapB family protein [Candidatus Pacearchaeota archaeon]|nr:antitoxin VapB family protein [Candidatus Pacearchaeota archaeon]
MAKIISISDDVYRSLTVLKGKESYSNLIRKLVKRKTNKDKILEFAGTGGMDENEVKKIREEWRKWSGKYA